MAAIDDDSVDEAVYSLYGLVVTDGSISVMNKAEGAFYSDQLRTLSDVKACRAALAVLRQSIDDAAADVRKLRAALTDERIDARVGRVASAMVAMQEGMHLVYACKIALNAGERTIVFTQAECDRLLQLWQTFWDAMLARPLMHRFRHQEPESPPTYSDSFYRDGGSRLLNIFGGIVLYDTLERAEPRNRYAQWSLEWYRARPSLETALSAKFALEMCVLGVVATEEMCSHRGVSFAPAYREKWRACGAPTKRRLADYSQLYLDLRDAYGRSPTELGGLDESGELGDRATVSKRPGERAFRMLLAAVHALGGSSASSPADLRHTEETSRTAADSEWGRNGRADDRAAADANDAQRSAEDGGCSPLDGGLPNLDGGRMRRLTLEAAEAARVVGQGHCAQYLLYLHVRACVRSPSTPDQVASRAPGAVTGAVTGPSAEQVRKLVHAQARVLEERVWSLPLQLGALGHANWARRAQLLAPCALEAAGLRPRPLIELLPVALAGCPESPYESEEAVREAIATAGAVTYESLEAALAAEPDEPPPSHCDFITRDIVMAHREKGNAAAKAGKWDLALSYYSVALEEAEAAGAAPKPLFEIVYKLRANRALAHMELGQPTLALEDARAALRAAPDWPKAHFRVGVALLALGRASEAVPALRYAQVLDGRDPAIASKLAEAIGASRSSEISKLEEASRGDGLCTAAAGTCLS